MSDWSKIIELADILESEWRGRPIDRQRAGRLARELLTEHPEIHHTLTSVVRRMAEFRARIP